MGRQPSGNMDDYIYWKVAQKSPRRQNQKNNYNALRGKCDHQFSRPVLGENNKKSGILRFYKLHPATIRHFLNEPLAYRIVLVYSTFS